MKKLKKILLINWLYFSKELIEVGDINFLTGKNGAGSQRSSMHCRSCCWARQFPQFQSGSQRKIAAHIGRLSARRHDDNSRIPAVVRTFLPILSANFRMRWRAAAL